MAYVEMLGAMFRGLKMRAGGERKPLGRRARGTSFPSTAP